jgi:hypothetical protein
MEENPDNISNIKITTIDTDSNNIKYIILFGVTFLIIQVLIFITYWYITNQSNHIETELLFIKHEQCHVCMEFKKVLKQLTDKYPNLIVKDIDVIELVDGLDKDQLKSKIINVPMLFIQDGDYKKINNEKFFYTSDLLLKS